MTEQELTAARLAVNDWHACATNEELGRWRAAQARLIIAAKASVYPELEALRKERDALLAEREAIKVQLSEAKKWIGALEDTITPEIAHEANALCNRREDEP